MKEKCQNGEMQTTSNSAPTPTPTAPVSTPDAPVNFWSVGEHRWFPSEFFPPKEVEEFDLSLSTVIDDYQSKHKQRGLQPAGSAAPASSVVQNQYKLLPWKTNDYFIDDENPLKQTLSSIRYAVDYEAKTEGISRWLIAKHPFRMPSVSYRKYSNSNPKQALSSPFSSPFSFVSSLFRWSTKNRSSSKTGDLLMFTSAPAKTGFRMVGSPLLRFPLNLTAEFERRANSLSSKNGMFNSHNSNGGGGYSIKVNRLSPTPALDVTIFGYIEDVDHRSGVAHYVTEGRALLSHRPTVFYHSDNRITGLDNWKNCIRPPYIQSDDGTGADGAAGPAADADAAPATDGYHYHHLSNNHNYYNNNNKCNSTTSAAAEEPAADADATPDGYTQEYLRQTSRIGSADVVYQTGEQSKHHFSTGMMETSKTEGIEGRDNRSNKAIEAEGTAGFAASFKLISRYIDT